MASKPKETAAAPKKNLAIHLLSGGIAGFAEAVTCHPLGKNKHSFQDTIKVRLQLRGERLVKNAATANAGFIRTGLNIVQKEGFPSLYKGLGAVTSGIVPKMAIRFSSFEFYKDL